MVFEGSIYRLTLGYPKNFSARILGIGLFFFQTKYLQEAVSRLSQFTTSGPFHSNFQQISLNNFYEGSEISPSKKKTEVQGGSLLVANRVITPISSPHLPVPYILATGSLVQLDSKYIGNWKMRVGL